MWKRDWLTHSVRSGSPKPAFVSTATAGEHLPWLPGSQWCAFPRYGARVFRGIQYVRLSTGNCREAVSPRVILTRLARETIRVWPLMNHEDAGRMDTEGRDLAQGLDFDLLVLVTAMMSFFYHHCQ
ncbi:hypothetical protein MRB53_041034 [Persea americana]|nr:hypothetical protein MRB53_041034 [Persea americana]